MKERGNLSEYLHEREKPRGLITTLTASWSKSNSACRGKGLLFLCLTMHQKENSISLTFKIQFSSSPPCSFYSLTACLEEKD